MRIIPSIRYYYKNRDKKNFHEWPSFVRGEREKRKGKYWKSVGIIVERVEKPIIVIDKLNGDSELIGDCDLYLRKVVKIK